MKTRQQEDLEMWRDWRATKDPKTLNNLLDKLNPLIQREVNKWGTTVPRPALESKARLLTVSALENYNPNKGAAIGTHVASRIRKISREVYPYQNVARLPENKQLKYNTFQVAHNKLYDNLGREPTVEEMADELVWPIKRIRDFQRSFGRKEYVESEGAFFEKEDSEDSLVDFYYHGLAPNDQQFFEDITGYNGKVPLNNQQLMTKYKMSQGQLSYRKRKFIDDLSDIQKGKR
jgi:DNA-directed RNA polymerase specialized sigma subunit